MNTDDIKHAVETAQGLVRVLQGLNARGTAVDSLLLLPMILRAADLKNDLSALYGAKLQSVEQAGADPRRLFIVF